jgi:4-amino-4-deoxy-L-arabinose transferase-like glycosyltransferase
MPAAGKHLLLIVLLAIVTFFTNLGGPRLWDRDEPRNAGCAVEMLERGDWVVPMFNAELRIHKPVLLYWFMMSSYALFGQNEFGARFWSAVLAVGTVAMTYGIGRRMFSPRVGVWAALILTTTLMFNVAARAATPDSVLIFFGTLALMIYVYSVPWNREGEDADSPAFSQTPLFPQTWRSVIAMYAVMGIAILAKGPVGLVLPTAVIGMYMLIRGLPARPAGGRSEHPTFVSRVKQVMLTLLRPFAPRHFVATCWQMRLLTATIVALLVAAPWYIWVGLRTDGAWLQGFFVEHNLGRAAQPMEGHGGSLLYYPIATLLGFFPWSIFAVPVILDAVGAIRRNEKWSAGYLFSLCWVGVFIGLFSIARTKLPSYVTPMYPGLALVTSVFVVRWLEQRTQIAAYWPRVSFGSLIAAGGAMVIGLGIALHMFTPGAQWLAAIGLIPMVAGIAAWIFHSQENRLAAVRSLGLGAVLLVIGMFGFAAVEVDRHRHDDLLLASIRENHANPEAAVYRLLEPSWVFYFGRPIEVLSFKSIDEPINYLREHENGFLITRASCSAEILSGLPSEVQILAEIPKFLEAEHVVVIGRPANSQYMAKRIGDDRPWR